MTCRSPRRQARDQADVRQPGRLTRSSAVLDEAQLGDIEGALGRIRVGDEEDQRRTIRRRLLTFLAIMGPGIIVMVGDNDAGGVATYAQAGQNYTYTLLWVLLLLVPVLIVDQEMVVRLGAVTGVGHARLINERFGRFWGWFSVGGPLPAQLPDDHHRVHRHLAGPGVLRSQQVHRGTYRRRDPHRHHHHRKLPALGGSDAAVHRLEPGPVPPRVLVPSRLRRHR
jgi:hypothetical protein